jgi:hypothetical protein
LATARLRFLFLAARIWRHAGRVGISYSDHYAEQSVFDRLMMRLRSVAAHACSETSPGPGPEPQFFCVTLHRLRKTLSLRV